MKKIIFMLVMLLSSLMCNAQQKVTQIGSTFKVEKPEKSSDKKEEVKTQYFIEVEGKKYSIYKGKKGGYYYYNFQGKKKYVPKEVKEKILGKKLPK